MEAPMPTVHFLGEILPKIIPMSLNDKSVLKWQTPTGLVLEFMNHITNSQIDVECKLNRYTPQDFEEIHKRAFEICRASVNLAAFRMGCGFTIVFETFVDPSGAKLAIVSKDDTLAPLCTAFDLMKGFHTVHAIVLQDWRIFDALNDLILAISLPHVSPVNCARAVERLRNLIASPGSNRKNAWRQMRDALQIDEAYLKFITDNAVEARHGGVVYIPGNITTEVRRRAWAIMNRYFEYRKNGSKPLSVNDFPLLTG
jgi:hypothetical protein